MSFERAEQIANAIMHEGYMLYPYRASALKNRFRWQFGVVAPHGYCETDGSERCFTQTECLAELGSRAALTIKLRFFQIEARRIEIPSEESLDSWSAVNAVSLGDDELTTWDEAVEQEHVVTLPADAMGGRAFPLEVQGGCDVGIRHDATGRAAARVVRERWPVSGRMVVSVERCATIGQIVGKITVRVENLTPWNGVADRAVVLRQSLVGAHVLFAIEDGAFMSLQDPSPEMEHLARSCINVGSWPALVGPAGSRDVILASPIILGDYPAIAPESIGNLFDATEIDELLTLRVMTLTDGEKREARATDEKTRRMIDRTDGASPEDLRQLHGAFRGVDSTRSVVHPAMASADPTNQQTWEALLNPPSAAAPEHATLDIDGVRVGAGSHVRLNPHRRADSMDMFLAGRRATVMGVYRTLEDEPYVAVTVDDDPGAELRRATGRFFYFSADEIVASDLDVDGDSGPEARPRS